MITSLTLNNWCQHSHRVLNFGPGMIALIGANGSGKSNIQGAVKWLWTGLNPNFGTKQENIYQLSQPHERANATMTMTKRGHTYEVFRSLRPESDRASLIFDGTVVAGGETQVTAKLAELYGLDPKLVDRFMLVAQDDIFGFLAEQPDVRLKLFQQLFDTTHAARCIKAITDHDVKLPQPTVNQSDLDTVLTSLQQKQTELQQAEQLLAATESVDDFAAAQSNDQRVVDAYAAYLNNVTQVEQLEAEVSQLTAAITPDRTSLAELQQAETAVSTLIATNRDAVTAVRAALVNLQNYQQIAQQRQQWQSLAAQLESQATTAPLVDPETTAPEAPKTDPRIFEVSSQISSLNAEILTDQEYVAVFRKDGVAACPTCRAPAANIAPIVDKVNAEISGKQSRLAAMRDELTNLQATATDATNRYLVASSEFTQAKKKREQQLAAHNAWAVKNASREAELARLRSQLSAPVTLEPVTGDAAEWQKTINTQEEAEKTLGEVRNTIGQLQTKLAKQEGTLTAKAVQLQTVRDRMAGAPTAAEATAAATRITVRASQQTLFVQRTAAVAGLRPQVENLQTQATALQQKLREASTIRNWIAEGAEVQEALKQSQKIVLQTRLAQAEGQLNELLRICDAPFTVAADESLNFSAIFNDGRRQGARRLSGGQKTLLAWLFRIAVAVQFAENLDVLFLDEPTAYLDKKAIAAFSPVFERIRGILADRGLQVIIVTHEEELAPLFDHVISL